MIELSSAAQAVSNAFWNPGTHVGLNYRLVMALRAVAKNCVPDDSEGHWVYTPHILAIATEIETNYCGLGIELENANE
jgi:hypothetical protein